MSIQFQENVSLKPHNTLALDVKARFFVHIEHLLEIEPLLTFINKQQHPLLVLGEGSNIVLADDFPGVVAVIATKGITVVEDNERDVLIRVSAGENWHEFVTYAIQQQWHGIENLALIPGLVGASPIQNIGAYGVEVADVIESVEYINRNTGELHTLLNADCEFAYRESIFKRKDQTGLKDIAIITAVSFRLNKQFSPQLRYKALMDYLSEHNIEGQVHAQQVYDAVIAIRQSKLPNPSELPNAGSFFKNPIVPIQYCEQLLSQFPTMPTYDVDAEHKKVAAAWLIEQAGWKGKSLNGMGMHKHQAVVLVNYDNASPDVLFELTRQVQQSIRDTFNVELEMEPQVYPS